jgi:hypothetical protein
MHLVVWLPQLIQRPLLVGFGGGCGSAVVDAIDADEADTIAYVIAMGMHA